MKNVIICIPIKTKHVTKRNFQIKSMFKSLIRAIKASSEYGNILFDIIVVTNGGDEIDMTFLNNYLINVKKTECSYFYIQKKGKINAINYIIDTNLDNDTIGFMVIDDDILLPKDIFINSLWFLKQNSPNFNVLCFQKTSITWDLKSNFQKKIAYFFSRSVQNILVKCIDGYKIQPSGSCYIIHKKSLLFFPDPCNEADILKKMKYKISDCVIKTWYPKNIKIEINRRLKQFKTHHLTLDNNFEFKSESFIHLYKKIVLSNLTVSDKICKKIINSAKLISTILEKTVQRYDSK